MLAQDGELNEETKAIILALPAGDSKLWQKRNGESQWEEVPITDEHVLATAKFLASKDENINDEGYSSKAAIVGIALVEYGEWRDQFREIARIPAEDEFKTSRRNPNNEEEED